MQVAFDQIIDRLIDTILFGDDDDWECEATLPTGDKCGRMNSDESYSCTFCKAPKPAGESILDIKLDLIIDQTVNDFARATCDSLTRRLERGRVSKQFYYSHRASEAFERGDVAIVKSVPRGWLNSSRKPKALRRMQVPDSAIDRTPQTRQHLAKFSLRPPPRGPNDQESPRRDAQEACGKSSALQQRVRQIAHNGTWQVRVCERSEALICGLIALLSWPPLLASRLARYVCGITCRVWSRAYGVGSRIL